MDSSQNGLLFAFPLWSAQLLTVAPNKVTPTSAFNQRLGVKLQASLSNFNASFVNIFEVSLAISLAFGAGIDFNPIPIKGIGNSRKKENKERIFVFFSINL